MGKHDQWSAAAEEARRATGGAAGRGRGHSRRSGLPSHPDHEIARGQMSGFGGMICVDLTGGYDAACRAFDHLQVFQRAASLGGTESLYSLPALTSYYGLSDERLAEAGVTRWMLRLSVGLEGADDLVADLDQALK